MAVDWIQKQREWEEACQARYDSLDPRIPGGVQPGWQKYVGEAALILDEICPEWRLDQVKEKFGGLRMYIATPEGTPFALFKACNAVTHRAESLAAYTCEWCGEHGKLRDGSWLRTLCDDCNVKSEEGYRPWQQ
jgi:hypothetical protein